MNILRNAYIVNEFNVSFTTVSNWIDGAREGRNRLKVVEIEGKFYVEDNGYNRILLEEMSNRGRNYKSREERAVVKPKKEFYQKFSNKQISEIILSLENHKEIPHKFCYFENGAIVWDSYTKISMEEKIANPVTNTQEMLRNSVDYVISNAQGSKFNVIDIGVGNSQPVKEFLNRLLEANILNKYVAVDISQDMIDISRSNVEKWFKELKFISYLRDISTESLHDILVMEADKQSRNLVMFTGSTIENQRNWKTTLESITDCLSKSDTLFLGQTLDNKLAKLNFDFKYKEEEERTINPNDFYKDWQELILPNLLNITSDLYQVEMTYLPELNMRTLRFNLLKDLSINFEHEKFNKTVNFLKGDKIILWRHKHHKLTDIVNTLDELNLDIGNLITSTDKAQVMSISKLKN